MAVTHAHSATATAA